MSHNTNKRIAQNTLFLYFRTLVILLVSLYTSRVVLNVLAGMCGVVLILCCYLDISRVKADIDEINGLCENRL